MMMTRCPGCATTFRVTPEQVKARHGKVRCGRCQHVFDAIEFLVDAVAAQAAPESPEVGVGGAAAHTHATETATPSSPLPRADLADLVVAPAADDESSVPAPASNASIDTSQLEPEASVHVVVAAVEDTAVIGTEDKPSSDAFLDEPTAQPQEHAAAGKSVEPADSDLLLQPSPLSAAYAQTKRLRVPRWPWIVAVLLALLALTAQVLIAFRTEIAIQQPGLRPLLDTLCAQANCVVELPSNPDLVGIEASDLHPAPKSGLELTATLRNRAPYAQRWPDLELTLTDGADKPIVRKVILPAQYLPATLSANDGFAANSDLAVKLQLSAGTLPAMGYRLYLFYP